MLINAVSSLSGPLGPTRQSWRIHERRLATNPHQHDATAQLGQKLGHGKKFSYA